MPRITPAFGSLQITKQPGQSKVHVTMLCDNDPGFYFNNTRQGQSDKLREGTYALNPPRFSNELKQQPDETRFALVHAVYSRLLVELNAPHDLIQFFRAVVEKPKGQMRQLVQVTRDDMNHGDAEFDVQI